VADYEDFFNKAAGNPSRLPKGSATTSSVAQGLESVNTALIRSPEVMASGKYDEFFSRAAGIASGEPKGQGGVLGAITSGGIGALEKIGYALGSPARVVASAAKETKDFFEGEMPSLKDFVSQAGQKDFYLSKVITADTGVDWLDTTLNLGVDILGDPLTYIGVGAVKNAGRGGRVALSERAATMPELFDAPMINEIARFGQFAKLDDAQKAALEIQHGLRFQFGKQGLLFSPETATGMASAKVGEKVGRAVSTVRANIGDVLLPARVREVVTPRSYRILGDLGRKNATTSGANLLARVAAHSSSVSERANEALFESIARGEARALLDEATSSPYRETIYQVIDGVRPPVDAVEADLAARMKAFVDKVHGDANVFINEVNGRRGINASVIERIDDYGIKRSLTPEARAWVNSSKGKTSKSATAIAEATGLTKQEFISGPDISRMRRLTKDAEFLGETLQVGSVDEINQIAMDKLGFKWFETDAPFLMSDYISSASKSVGRVAFVDRLLDFSPEIVNKIMYKIVPTEGVDDLTRAVDALLNIRKGVAQSIDVLDAKGLKIVDGTLARAEAELAGGVARTAELQSSRRVLQRNVKKAEAALAKAEARAATAAGEARAAYETVLQPLRTRIAYLRNAVDSADSMERAAMEVLAPIHQRVLPDVPVPASVAEVYNAIDAALTGRVAGLEAQIAAGDDAAKVFLPYAKGQVTRFRNQADEITDQAIAAKTDMPVRGRPIVGDVRSASVLEGPVPSLQTIDYKAAQSELRRANALLARKEKAFEKAISTETEKALEQPLKARTQAITALDNNKALKVEQRTWEREVRPALQDLIDELKQVRGMTVMRLDDAGRVAMNELDDILKKGVGVGASTSPIPQGVEHARAYAQRLGRDYVDVPEYTLANPSLTKEIADAYNALPSGVPPVGSPDYEAYMALKKEIKDQYKYLTEELGIKIEFTMDDPYPDAADMVKDILFNKRLRVYADYLDHPLLGIDPETGIHENAMFRAIHDYFGHAAGGSRFDRNGEELAFLRHIQMFSPEASRAATSELRGQNSVLIAYGSFPEQKAYLLPEVYSAPDPMMGRFVDEFASGGGSTIDVAGKEILPSRGYVVGLGGEFEFGIPTSLVKSRSDLTDRLIAPFLSNPNVREELMKQNRWLGGWYDEKNDMFWVGVSTVISDKRSAFRALVKNNQLAAWDLGEGADVFTIDGILAKESSGIRLTRAEQEFRNNVQKKIDSAIEGGSEAQRYRRPEGGTRSPFDVATGAESGRIPAQGKQAGDLGGPKGLVVSELESRTNRIGELVDTVRLNSSVGMSSEWSSRTDNILNQINNTTILNANQKKAWDKVFTSLQANEVSLAKAEAEIAYNTGIRDLMKPPVSGPFGIDDLPPSFYGNIEKDIREGWAAIEGLGIQMPKELGDLLFGRIADLGTASGFMEMFDIFKKFNQFFRVTAMLTPGFIVRNSYTAAFNNFAFGCTLRDTDEGIRFATVLHRRGAKAALDSLPEAGRETTELAYKAVLAAGLNQTEDIIQPVIQASKQSRIYNNRVVRAWSKGNQDVETAVRMTLALRAAKNGMNLDEITAAVSRYHFNYGDLSKLDEYAKVFLPFWIFASRNIPLQITNQIMRPSVYRAYEGVQRSYPADENLIMPEWLARREPLGFGRNAVINPDLPQIDMEDQIRQFADPLRLLSQFYPQYRLIPELAGNRMYGTGVEFSSKLEPVRGPLDYPSALLGLLTGQTVQTAEGPALTSKGSYLLPQIFPTLATAQRLVPQLGGQARYQERQGSSIASALGVPYRAISEEEQERTLTGREIQLQNLLKELQKRGYVG
jgi:hypothetical protein